MLRAPIRPVFGAASAVCLLAAGTARADAPAPAPPEDAGPVVVTVWGDRAAQIDKALSASEGVVEFGRFAERPLLRVGELAEVVPGLAATQHSGTGKANQYFLRGFNLDHGTDFSISLDGMPLNLRTSAHGQGYLDINFLIPEIVERIAYRKGVAHAAVGDFSAAGSAAFTTFARLPESFAQVEIGKNAWRRLVTGVSLGPDAYVALDLTHDDGPWVRPERFRKSNAFARWNRGGWSFGAGAYHASWNAADQIPLRAVEAGLIDRLGSIDPDVGGSSQRVFAHATHQGESGLTATAHVMAYRLDLFSNFTYLLDDPVDGDAFEQQERRLVFGGSLVKAFAARGAWAPRAGVEARFDRLDPVGLHRVAGRARLATVREDRVDQDSLGAFAEAEGRFDRLRINLGVRLDAMRVAVASDDPRNSGRADDAIVSPKLALAWRIADDLEAYASAGRGFHSNDARGATIAFDPAGGDPADRVPLLVAAGGLEAGLRFERPGLAATLSVFGLNLDSELVYVGDAGATEPSDASRRSGVEITATWAPVGWLTLDAAAAATRARLKGVAPGQDRIPLATEHVLTGGATLRLGSGWTAALTLRHLGPAPLIEDGSVRSEASTVANARLAWRGGRFTLALEALNLFDGDGADITYFYASRLAGEPADGVEDIHFHPIPPRSLRVQARVGF
jgi:outer membrane receptor protein involved in Fe transport